MEIKLLILIICVLPFLVINASASVIFEEGQDVYGFNTSSQTMTDTNGLTYEYNINGYMLINNERNMGFAVKGTYLGTDYTYTSLDYTWTWEHITVGNDHIFNATNNDPNFMWKQSWYFYEDPATPMKIEHYLKNNYSNSITDINMYYIIDVDDDDTAIYNNTHHNIGDILSSPSGVFHRTGDFNSIIPKIQLPESIFNFEDLIDNGFTINEFYIGDGSMIDKPALNILAVGFTKGAGTLPSGVGIKIDPTFSTNVVRCISMTPLDIDSVVVAWLDNTNGYALFAIYNIDGTVEVSPVTVDATTGTPKYTSVVIDAFNSTHFVYAWYADGTEDDAYYSVYNSAGSLVSGPFTVDDAVGNSDAVGVSALNETHIAYGWYDLASGITRVAIYDSSGNSHGSAEVVTNNWYGRMVSVNAFNDTHFVYSLFDSTPGDVSFIIYDTGLNVVTSITDVDDSVGTSNAHGVAVINETHFVISWFDDTDDDITFSIYDTSGNLVTGPTDVNTNIGTDEIESVSVTMLNDTHFVIAIDDNNLNSVSFVIYDTAGNLVTGPTEVYNLSASYVSVVSQKYANNIGIGNDGFLYAYANDTATGIWEAFDSSGAEWDGSLLESTTATLYDVYGFSTGNIPSNATILSLKNEGISTIEYEIDWDNITSEVWVDIKEAMSYASSQNVRSALKFNFSGDYTSETYRTQVKTNFSAYTPDLQGHTYWTNIKYITIDFDNGAASDSEKKDFGNNIATNLTTETDDKFTIMTEESLTGLNADIQISPIKYITLSSKSNWIDDEVSTLRESTTILRMYSGNSSFLDTVNLYKTHALDFMRDDSAVGSQYAETDTVKLNNGDIIFYNNDSSVANVTIASPATGYYFDTINDVYFNRSTAGTIGFNVPAENFTYVIKDTFEKITLTDDNDDKSVIWSDPVAYDQYRGYYDSSTATSSWWIGSPGTFDLKMEFWNPQYERINLLMLHYAWINSTAISDYSDYKHIVIADKNSDGIDNTIANKPHTYGYVSIGDYADTGTWETNKKADFDVWTETHDVNIFMDDIDTAYMGTGFLPRFINLTEHIRETRGKKVILNTYTNYDELAIYGDSVMKESAIARWSGNVNDPTYAWETPSVDVDHANFFARHNTTVIGISFGAIDDYERLAYCSNAFAVIYGFDGHNSWRYSQPNFQAQTEVFIYDYGEMLENNFTEASATDWHRLYENGRVHINPVDHTYWIENDLVVNSFDISFHVYDGEVGTGGDANIYIYLNGSENDPYSIPFDAPGWGWYNRSASVNVADYNEHGHYMFYAYTRATAGSWSNIAYSDVATSGGQHTWFDTTANNLPATFTAQTWSVHDSSNPDINYHTWIDINISRSEYLNPIDKIDQTSSSSDDKMTTNISSDNSYPMKVISALININAESSSKTYFKALNGTWIEASVNTVTDITLNSLNWAYTVIDGMQYGAVRQSISATEYIYRYLFPQLSSMEAYTEEIPTYIPPNATSLANTTGKFWVNHTWSPGVGAAGEETIYLISGDDDGTFTGYNWTGSTWQSDTAIISDLGDVELRSKADAFEKDGTTYLISGEEDGIFNGYNWTGSTWQNDSAIISGLVDVGTQSNQVVFQMDSTWYLIAGEVDGVFNGYNWTGSTWQSDTGIISGLVGVGQFSNPDVFQMDSTWYLISGEADGVFNGYNWTGSTWQSDSAIISGLVDVGIVSDSDAFQIDSTWYLIAGNYAGDFAGYNWTGSTWQSDSAIKSGLSETGTCVGPTVFAMSEGEEAANNTDSYNVSVNDVWYNTTTDLHFNDTYSPHEWQNITVWAYNSSGSGTLSAGSVSDNKQIPNNVPVLSGVSASYNLYENETLTIDADHTDADSDTITYSDNASEWDINPSTGEVSWVLDWEDVAGSPYSYRITIDDGEGGTDYQDFTVTINGAQNTALTSVDTSFENGFPGTDYADNVITLSFYLINSGSIDADISAKFTTDYESTYGLVSGTSTIGGSNFKLGNATLDTLLDNGNSVDLTDDVPGEVTQRNYEVQLRVPSGQSALAYSGTVELTFSDAI